MNDFDYLDKGVVYLDSACQSLRPRPVLAALNSYYENHNACGERAKYKWGKTTDALVAETREKVLKFLKLKSRDYAVSFTLNTTYGINLLLSQLDPDLFEKIMTSDIEHNSPFLATMAFSERTGLPRIVMKRNDDGSIPLENYDFQKPLVVVNCASNFDGRKLKNLTELEKTVHKQSGILIIDAAQTMAHSSSILEKSNVDAICFSAHKLYAPSLGVIVWKKSLLKNLKTTFIGGGMVDDVEETSYQLSATSPDHIHTKFESGLQAWGEIIALGAALDWLKNQKKSAWQTLDQNSRELYDFLGSSKKVHLVNHEPNPTISLHIDGLDSHLLGEALSREDIMARTGYFCAHYYLDHVCHFPPLIRFSLGLHNTPEDIKKLKTALAKILK
ncbi:aminotransferase class V-fold PLP-dependent enzyme [Candidatus Saccharibacteria bacterium]|nr:aminotransferase class V-fold PLP-dependent enzyme [Candidatus Saccharibacteria bacterium]